MLKKLVLSFLASLVLLQSAAGFVSAQQPATWYNQGIQEWYLKVFDTNVSAPEEIFGERYTFAQVDWIIWSFITWLPTKIIKPDGTACLIGVIAAQSIDFSNCWSAFFGAAGDNIRYANLEPKKYDKSLAQMIFTGREFSGVAYVKNLARKLSVPEARAQGFGFTRALEPFRQMWLASRDVSYALFIFAAIILAFMVMFRVKLSPQTAVSVQSAIPKLIFSLLLVTFSYAIAGFLVDLTYVLIGLVSIVGARFGGGDARATYEFLTIGPVVPTSIGGVTIPGGGTPLGLLGLFFTYISLFTLTFIIAGLSILGQSWLAVVGVLAAIAVGVFALIATGLGTIALILFFVGMLILLVAILVMVLKTWWTIMKAFANIILLTIFAPFQLLLGTFIPSMGFGAWVKSYISNLAVFIAVGFLFLLATIFCIQAFGSALRLAGQPDSIFRDIFIWIFNGTPDVIGDPTPGWPPLIVSSSDPAYLSIIYLIFSLVIFFQIPKSADIIKSFISGRPWAYGTAIGEGLGLFGTAYNAGPMGAIRKGMSEQAGSDIAGWASSSVGRGGVGKGRELAKGIASYLGRFYRTPQVK